jgi:hypothetical protein
MGVRLTDVPRQALVVAVAVQPDEGVGEIALATWKCGNTPDEAGQRQQPR